MRPSFPYLDESDYKNKGNVDQERSQKVTGRIVEGGSTKNVYNKKKISDNKRKVM